MNLAWNCLKNLTFTSTILKLRIVKKYSLSAIWLSEICASRVIPITAIAWGIVEKKFPNEKLMPTKSVLQDTLKAKYGINKNITQSLSAVECEELLTLLQSQPTAIKLVESFIAKNEELSRNNRNFGQQRSQAQQKLKFIQAEHEKLEQAIKELEKSNSSLVDRRGQLSGKNKAISQKNSLN